MYRLTAGGLALAREQRASAGDGGLFAKRLKVSP
jgi:hypothetical protein